MSQEPASSSSTQEQTTTVPLLDRDLSWMQFNFRVLEEAEDRSNPLFERIKFLSITVSNLNEFYMVRVSGLETLIIQAQRKGDQNELLRLITLRCEIFELSKRFSLRILKTLQDISILLNRVGIHISENVEAIKNSSIAYSIFKEEVLAHLPNTEPFTFEKLSELSNLEVAVIYSDGFWIRIPSTIPGVITTKSAKNGFNLFFLDHLLTAFLTTNEKRSFSLLRLTRSANDSIQLPVSDHELIKKTILDSLHKRNSERVVRLEVQDQPNNPVVEAYRQFLKLEPQQVFFHSNTFFVQSLLNAVQKIPRKFIQDKAVQLKPLAGWIPRSFSKKSEIFDKLDSKDYLLHHPYDSFDSYIAFIEAAANDPYVSKIEHTFYRTEENSAVVEHLKSAAKRKQVHVCIESRARFDELNNLRLGDEFTKAGVKVLFGSGKLKLHAKIALVTRELNGQIKHYTHLSTGNYNAITSRQYTDLSVLTCNSEIGLDARQFFDSIYSGEIPSAFRKLVIAPQFLARRMLSYIKDETEITKNGGQGRIFIKVNALVDPKIIESLYTASQAGVKVDLVVRGACSLIPEIPGISENIRVISIVDRFLEHSRFYFFGSSKKLYLSSADWMPRNFFSRLEIAFPILDPRILNFFEEAILPAYLSDNVKARKLGSNGMWRKQHRGRNSVSQQAQLNFEKLSEWGYVGTALE